jgi:hypothetical protein
MFASLLGELVSVVSAFARRHGAFCFVPKRYRWGGRKSKINSGGSSDGT